MTVVDYIIFTVPMIFAAISAAYFFRSRRFVSKPKMLRTILSSSLSFILAMIWGLIILKILNLGSYIINDTFSVFVLSLLYGFLGALLFWAYFPRQSQS